jgi:hypothetical protein
MTTQALKEAALAATPGPWGVQCEWSSYSIGGVCHLGTVSPKSTTEAEQYDANANYLSLANPTSILSLIARLERAEAALSGITLLIGNVDHSAGGGENTARMYGVMLNDIRDMSERALEPTP